MPQPSLTTLATLAATGTHPYGALVEDAAGNLYGTTGLSPTDGGATTTQGSIFELVKGASTVTTLATFSGVNGTDPVAGLTLDAAGNLFGATAYGGSAGKGTLFELVKGAAAVTTLATFSGANGAVPQSVLTADAAGNLFGVTNQGGSANVGTLFELVKGAAAVTTLASFTGGNGAFAEGGVTIDAAGNIYGTTVYGGSTGPGTIFELAKGATAVTTLASFTGPNGSTAKSGLTVDAAGNLYGVTYGGGSANDGTLYELAKGATAVATLATFTGANGANPIGNLAIDAAGNLYGTTNTGGAGGAGTVFKLLKGASVVSTLATFTAATGGNPYAGLTVDAAGNLFGTTSSGNGTVFELPAFIPFVPLNVATSSPDTTALLAIVNLAAGALPTANVYTDNGGPIPAATVAGSALLLPAALGGTVEIPAGYDYVEVGFGSAVNLTGGDANTKIIGDSFTYSGAAAWVGSGTGATQITDNAAAATILIGSTSSSVIVAGGAGASVSVGDNGTSTTTLSGAAAAFATGSNSHFALTASGNTEKIVLGNGALGTAVVSGAGDVIGIGGNNVAQAGTAPATGLTTQINGTAGIGNIYNITDADSRNLLALGTSDTVNVAAGVSTIFGLAGDVVGVGLAQVEFVGGSGVSTVIGGAANVVMFATTGQVFDAGSGQANVFVGGTGTSTINAGAGGGSFFGGSQGDRYNFGTSAAQTFVGLGGKDTLVGAAGTVAPVVFAFGAETMAIAAAAAPVTVVSFASGGLIDASATGGNNRFFAGYGLGGNQTLVGATAGADIFVAGANPSATATSITIDNWHAGDVFYLSGFTAADATTMDGSIAGSLAQGAVGDLSFTLADKTTITFVGQHPTNFDGAGAAF